MGALPSVLPLPGPPARAVKVRPSTAVTGPWRLVSFSTSITSGTLGAGVWLALLSR
jgi:hypothetical protein